MNMKTTVARLKRAPIKLEVMGRTRSEVSMRVPHEGGGYYVYLDMTGKGVHYCTCRDWSPYLTLMSRRRGRPCSHIVAGILLENRPDMLLPLMLRQSREK